MNKEELEITVVCDDLPKGARIASKLRSRFPKCSAQRARHFLRGFELHLPLHANPEEYRPLIEELLAKYKVDLKRFPLTVLQHEKSTGILLRLPLKAAAQGRLPSTSDSIHPNEGFVIKEGDRVRYGSVTLERHRGDPEHVPTGSSYFTYDQHTAETAEFVADAVAHGAHVLLEGPTGCSKTSVIVQMAAELGRPLRRVNLDGSADASALVGRFLPREDSNGFRWADGPLGLAMARGEWLLIDEMNLAPSDIAERINSAAEQPSTLTLTEKDGQVLVAHPEFRLFATQNPSTYAGRNRLAPSLLDRFRRWNVPEAGESEYQALVQFALTGIQPPVKVLGRSYPAWADPRHNGLPIYPELEDDLARLVRFHASLGKALSSAHTGGGYVLSRRSLIDVVHQVARAASPEEGSQCLRRALEYCYLGGIPLQDRDCARELMRSIGLQGADS